LQEVEAYGESDAVLWAISTSGNSKNVILAAKKAKEIDMHVIAMTGQGGGALSKVADILLSAPSNLTPRIQEVHMMVYHNFCQQVEAHFRRNYEYISDWWGWIYRLCTCAKTFECWLWSYCFR
jgi:DNA-binding MurR/RpiR family transcriptional regulator